MELLPKLRNAYTKSLPQWVRAKIENLILPPYPKEYDNHQYIFIHIPKTAGKSIISKLHTRGATHLSFSDYEKMLGDKLNHYFIFTVLRDPADRVTSAFYYLKAGGNQSKEDQDFSNRWIAHKSLDEFITTTLERNEVQASLFFRSQASFLKDRNGKIASVKPLLFESLDMDFAAISKRLGVSPNLPYKNPSRSKPDALSDKALHIVKRIYNEDYQLIENVRRERSIPK